MEKIIFAIENMKCAGCVSAIETALKTLDGIEDLNVSLENHQATLSTSIPAAEIANVITDAGFSATRL